MADYTVQDLQDNLNYIGETKQQIKQAIINKGQIITEEDTFRSYAQKIEAIETGDVKLFTSEEEMNQDPKAKEGDLAIIYKKDESKVLTEDLFINGIKLKTSFKTSTAITSYFGGYYNGIDTKNYNYSVSLSLNQTSASININMGNSNPINISYTSTDGINYTFTQWQEGDWMMGNEQIYDYLVTDTFNFGCPLKKQQDEWSTWTNEFGNMITPIVYNYNGLYIYELNHTVPYDIKTYTNLRVEPDEDGNKKAIGTVVGNIDCKMVSDKLFELRPDLFPEDPWMGGYGGISGIAVIKERDISGNVSKLDLYESLTNFRKFDGTLYLYNGYGSGRPTPPYNLRTKYEIDLINNVINSVSITPEVKEMYVGSSLYYAEVYPVGFNLATDEITPVQLNCKLNEYYISSWSSYIYLYDDYNSSDSTHSNNSYNFTAETNTRDMYISAPNQFTLAKENQIFDNLTAYGMGKVIQGDNSYLRNITGENFINTWLPGFENESNQSNLYDNTLHNGPRVNYQTFVERNEITFAEMQLTTDNDCVTVKADKEVISIPFSANTLLNKIYSAQQRRNNYFRYNGQAYWVWMGFNFNSTSSGDRKTLNNIYGVVYNLTTGELYKSIENNSAWRPFGSWSSDDCCDILSANYSIAADKWLITLDTAGYGFSNGPYYATIRIDGTSGSRSNSAVRLNRHGSGTYHRTNVDYYSISEDCFYVSTYDNNSNVYSVQKVTSSGGVSNVYTPGAPISNLGTLWNGSDNCFMIPEPIAYIRVNNNYYFRNFKTGASYQNNNIYNVGFTTCWIDGDYFYFVQRVPDGDTGNYTYDLCRMKYSDFSGFETVRKYSKMFSYTWYNNERVLYFTGDNYSIYSISDNRKLMNFNMSGYYNYLATDGIIFDSKTNSIRNEAYIKSTNSTELTLTSKKPRFYKYTIPTAFPISGELFYLGYKDSSTKDSYSYMYYASPITKQNVGTISPIEYEAAVDTTDKILGINTSGEEV